MAVDGAVLSVGFIDDVHPFTLNNGPQPRELLKVLKKLARHPHYPGPGYHFCRGCECFDDAPQNVGVIYVFDQDDNVYVTPTLIVHYIEEHRYRPPDAFIEAVMQENEPRYSAAAEARHQFDRLTWLLGQLASDRIQQWLDRKYGPWGSYEKYMMACDWISDYLSSEKGRKQLEEFAGPLAVSHLVSIEKLWVPYLHKYESNSLEEPLLNDPLSARIRKHANSALSLLDYDFEEHEAEWARLRQQS